MAIKVRFIAEEDPSKPWDHLLDFVPSKDALVSFEGKTQDWEVQRVRLVLAEDAERYAVICECKAYTSDLVPQGIFDF